MPIFVRLSFLICCCSTLLLAQPLIELSDPVSPPEWAVAERALLKAASDATVVFSDHFVDDRGYLKCVERWGGNDGGYAFGVLKSQSDALKK